MYQRSCLRLDDRRGRHRPGVEEDRGEGGAHRDLVGDHLRAGAQAAEQRVRRAGGPAGQHDAVDADRGHREDVEHRDRQVGQLHRGAVAEDRDLVAGRAEGDHRDRHEGRDRRDDRRQDVDDLVGPLDDDVFLEHQLDAVGERLEHAPGAVPVGADAQLHPGDDLALPHDGEEHGHHQEREAEHRLDDDEPPRVACRTSTGPRRRDLCGAVASGSRPVTRAPPSPAPAGAGRPGRSGPGRRGGRRCRRDAAAGGVQRQPDHPVGHLGDRSGSSTVPAGPVTASTSPSLTPGLGGRGGGEPGDGRVPGAGQGLVALLEPALVEQQPVAGEDRLARRRAGAAAAPVSGGLGGARARPSRRAGRARGGRPAGRAAPRSARPARRPACAARGRRPGRGGGSSGRA